MSTRIQLLILSGLVSLGGPAYGAVDLTAAYRAAVEKTEIIDIEKQRVLQAQERQSQSKGGLFPQLALNGRYTRQDVSNTTGANTAFTRPDQYSASLGLNQALFRGFAEFAELRRRDALVKSQQATEKRARLLLYRDVAARFFAVLSAEKDLANLKGLNELTTKRLSDIRGRVRIGRSRKGELLASQSQGALLEAQIQAAENEKDRSREAFRLVTKMGSDEELVAPTGNLPDKSAGLDTWLAHLKDRPDLQAREWEREAADESVGVAKGGHFPALDLAANYYLTRTGVLADSKWDFTVNFTLPIFRGGTVNAAVQEAVELRKQAELTAAYAVREAEAEVRTLHSKLVSSLDQVKTLRRASELAEENYKVQTADYRLGLVTNLEVIQALNTFQETKRVYDRTYFDTWATLAALEAAAGKMPL